MSEEADAAVEATIATLLGLDASWAVGYVLGLIVIVLFAREQLNTRLETESGERRLARIIQMFAPSQLRSSAVFFKGYVVYVGLLSAIYTLLSLGGASVIKLVAGDAGRVAEEGFSFDGASAPLLVALAMVGLAPSTPMFSRIEKHLRGLAHRVVGIPSTFHEFTEAIHGVSIPLDRIDDELLGASGSRRLNKVLGRAREVFGDGAAYDAFAQGVVKLFAFQAWEGSAATWPSWTVRSEFQRFESEISPIIHAVIEDLEDLADREHDAATADDDLSADPLHKRLATESRWRSLSERVQSAVTDACALFALYAERSDRPPQRDHELSRLLSELIDTARARREGVAPTTDIVTARLFAIAAVMFCVGAIGQLTDIMPSQGGSWARAGLLWGVGVLALYGPASLVALAMRQSATGQRSWRNAFDPDDVFPTVQYAQLFAAAFVTSALMMVSYVLLVMMLSHIGVARDAGQPPDLQSVVGNFLASDPGRLSQAATAVLFGLCGGAHGVLMALIGDAAELRDCEGSRAANGRTRGWLVFAHGGALAALTIAILTWNGSFARAGRIDETRLAADALAADYIAELEAAKDAEAGDATRPDCTPDAWCDTYAAATRNAQIFNAASSAFKEAEREYGFTDPDFARAVGGGAAIKIAGAAVKAAPENQRVFEAAVRAASAILHAGSASETATEQLRNDVRAEAFSRDVGWTPATWSLYYQGASAAVFGWLAGWLMMRPLHRLARRNDPTATPAPAPS